MCKPDLKLVPKGPGSHPDQQVVMEKLNDACTPGFAAPFTTEEAHRAGAFVEDAISEADAEESCIDLPAALERDKEQPS